MKTIQIKVKNKNSDYAVIIGSNILNILPSKIRTLCPKARKIGIVVDKNIPNKYKIKIKKILKKYQVYTFQYTANEKLKSFSKVNELTERCLSRNFNRVDVLIALGGGVIGDFTAFVASIIKRGINFINIPSTLLAQVDSSIGGKTGVNSRQGKNLIGTFYQPRLVISDVDLLKSLPRREVVCGYAEILKHSLILKNNFFNWLQINTKKILDLESQELLKSAVYKSCKIKLNFVNKDTNEKNVRMILNFGHTFAHAIELKNNFSKKINHGEAVLVGMMLAIKFSLMKKICSYATYKDVMNIYLANNLNYKLNKFFKKNEYNKIIDLMNNDKKNDDKKINLILIKKIGQTTKPGEHKYTTGEIKKILNRIT